jgi:hypothetical protein
VETSVTGQGEAELAEAVASLVADQVDLHKPRNGIVPLGPGPDRDLGFEQGAGLGMGPPPRDQFCPFTGQFAVDGRRAHPHQQTGLVIADRKLPIPAQQRHQNRQHRGQEPAGRCPQHRPAPDQCRQQVRSVDRRPAGPGSDDLQDQGVPQGRPGIVAVPTGQFDQLVQDPGLPCTIGALIGEGFLLRHSLPLGHR